MKYGAAFILQLEIIKNTNYTYISKIIQLVYCIFNHGIIIHILLKRMNYGI